MGLELIKGYLSFVNTGCSYSAVKVLAPTSVAAENFETQLGAGACSHKLLEHWSVPSRKAACEEHGGRPATRSERNEFALGCGPSASSIPSEVQNARSQSR